MSTSWAHLASLPHLPFNLFQLLPNVSQHLLEILFLAVELFQLRFDARVLVLVVVEVPLA